MADRKLGSMVLTAITGAALVVLGAAIAGSYVGDLKAHRAAVNAGACIVFGVLLLWWTVSEKKTWGIGFETVGMTVGVIAAVIAILTWTAEGQSAGH